MPKIPNYGGPRPRRSRTPEGTQIPTPIPSEQISFSKEAFDEMLRSQGVRVCHYRAIPDPTGMSGRGDGHPSSVPNGAPNGPGGSDGFLYQEAGSVQVFFQSNSTSSPMDTNGIISTSSAYITLPTTYENGDDPVIVSDYDRFYLQDIEVRVVGKHYVEASSTGTDRFQFPATCVEYAVGPNGTNYVEGQDFQLNQDGTITWISQNRPGVDPNTGRGIVYSVRYRYIPFFIVSRIIHEVRVAQITDPMTFDRNLERMPYQVYAIREKIFQDLNRLQPQTNGDLRYQLPPPGGTLGPAIPSPGGTLGPK